MTAQSIVQRPVTHSCSQYKQIEEIAMEQAHMDVRGRLEWTKVKKRWDANANVFLTG